MTTDMLQWQLQQRWDVTLSVPQSLAGALVVLAGLPSMLQPFPFPVPSGTCPGLAAA